MRCEHCKLPVTTRAPSVTQVTGWVRDRKAGGINQVRHAKPTGKVLCINCGDHLWHTGKLPSLDNEGQMELIA